MNHFADPAHVFAGFEEELAAFQQIAVLPAETDCFDILPVQVADDFFVDFARQHHLDDVHHFFVRDALPLHELRLDIQLFGEIGDFLAAAMHHDNFHAEMRQQRNILRETDFQLFIHHRRPAVFHDDHFPRKFLDVRQRLNQGFGQHFIFHKRLFNAKGARDAMGASVKNMVTFASFAPFASLALNVIRAIRGGNHVVYFALISTYSLLKSDVQKVHWPSPMPKSATMLIVSVARSFRSSARVPGC